MTTSDINKVIKLLGLNYSKTIIDFGQCVYRKLNDRYDVEIEGRNKQYQIYVWEFKGRIVEHFFKLKFEDLEITMNLIDEKYGVKE